MYALLEDMDEVQFVLSMSDVVDMSQSRIAQLGSVGVELPKIHAYRNPHPV
eukprot:m.469128 g.469128  ORF g.469128 m.469128 type:complete len:51 (+) comp21649_c0_seq19:934-1086(+)